MYFLSRDRKSSGALLPRWGLNSAVIFILTGLGLALGLFWEIAEKMLFPLEMGVTSRPPSRKMSNLRFFIGGSNEGIGRIESPTCLVGLVLLLLGLFVGVDGSLSLSLSTRSITSVGAGMLGLGTLLSAGIADPIGFPLKPEAKPASTAAPAGLPNKLEAIGVIVVRFSLLKRAPAADSRGMFSFSKGLVVTDPVVRFDPLPDAFLSAFMRTFRKDDVFEGVFVPLGGFVLAVLIDTVPLVGQTETSLIVRSGSVFTGNKVALMLFSKLAPLELSADGDSILIS